MRIPLQLGLIQALVVPWIASATMAAETGALVEDFEAGYQPARWSFSNGAEFPGAKGQFERTSAAAHEGQFGGRLTFDFTGGGNYVGATLQTPASSADASNSWAGLRLWLKRPEGHDVVFRYTDAAGQTFQKSVECPAGRWARITIPFSGWTVHWGGANDGKVRSQPKMLGVNIDHGQETTGALLFDDLRWVTAQESMARVSYPAYRFDPEERWHTQAVGNGGATRLEGRTWTADFSRGARRVSLKVPDHVLLGNVDKIRVRVRGHAPGHPVLLVLHTHFMTFQKTLGEFAGQDEQELVTDGPPGPGWEWYGGENDGKIHGPLRLGEIALLGGANPAPCTLELRDVTTESSCPVEARGVLLAESHGTGEDACFVARARALSDTPLSGELRWVLRDWDHNEIGQGRQPMTVPAKAQPVELRLPLTEAVRAQRKFLEAEITLDLPGQEVAPVQAAWVAASDAQGDAALEPESPFGMGVYLNRYGGGRRRAGADGARGANGARRRGEMVARRFLLGPHRAAARAVRLDLL